MSAMSRADDSPGARHVVQVVETKTDKVVASIPIDLAGLKSVPSEQEFYAEAWRCAVMDKSVDPARREDYSFRLVR